MDVKKNLYCHNSILMEFQILKLILFNSFGNTLRDIELTISVLTEHIIFVFSIFELENSEFNRLIVNNKSRIRFKSL